MGNSAIELSDGRALGFECLGDPEGIPLFFFHGTPGSRLVFSRDDLIAQIPGVRMIVPERPGYGISDPKPERVLLDWPDDVAELADHLGLDTFAVAGVSGGGPHALACAHRLARRVTMTLLFASPSPTSFKGATRGMAIGNKLAIWLGRYAPGLARRLTLSFAATFDKDPEGFMDSMAKQMAPPDRALMEKESVRLAILRDLREAYRQGGDAHAVDGALAMTSQGWGFELREITVPVFLWQGEKDTLVPRTMAEHLAGEIPGCTARFVPGAAHLLTDDPSVVEHMGKVLLKRGKPRQ